ncbi:MAG: ATP-binding protein [Spirochaetales bacterium]
MASTSSNLNPSVDGLVVDENSPLFDTKGMFYKEFPSDLRQVRYFTLLIVQKAPPEFQEVNLLEQQIGEIIKNAIRHGNNGDKSKMVRVWYGFDETEARLIVEDEGDGFQELERWNEFLRERNRCFQEQDFERMADYVSFRTDRSNDTDGGNAMFAAVEYWNGGIVYNEKRNKIALKKTFPKRTPGINIDGRG